MMTGAAPRAAAQERATLRRLLGFTKPYLPLLLAAFLCTVLFSAGRYGRAYLTKPLLDGVLVPVVSEDEAASRPTAGREPGAERGHAEDRGFSLHLPFDLHHALARRLAPSGDTPGSAGTDPDAPTRDEAVVQTLSELLLAGFLIVVITPLALFGRAYLAEWALARIGIDLKRAMAAKLLRLPLSTHVEGRSGDTLTRALSDTDGAAQALDLIFQDVLLAVTMLVLGVATLLAISVPLTGAALLAAPLVAGLVAGFGRRIRRSAGKRQSQLGEVTGRLLALLGGIKVIKAFGAEEAETRAFAHETDRLLRHDMRVVRSRVLSRALVEAVNSGVGIVLLLVGTALVLRGRFGLSVGDVAAFATVLATTYKPVKNLAKAHGRLMERLVSARRFFDVLDAEEEPADAPHSEALPAGPMAVRFDEVVFRHSGSTSPVLAGVSFDLEPGEVVALVGATGAGKSTIVDLLLRFHDAERGEVRVGGRDVRTWQRASLRESIALVSQEPFLFDGSLIDNVRYGRPDASDAAVLDAIRAARVEDFLPDLPEGLDTRVGEFGTRLSGGQRQRIAVARALLRDARIFVFDEATSALDVETERLVQDAIDGLRGDRVVLVVAHRTSTIRRADRVLLLEGGRIVEDGPLPAVAARSARFRELTGLDASATELPRTGRLARAPRAART
jgi:ABC-type multidrug transport system fused ATPase/permease subunit